MLIILPGAFSFLKISKCVLHKTAHRFPDTFNIIFNVFYTLYFKKKDLKTDSVLKLLHT